jgi:predicted short-subunit dehydrogenase-like oxidoreductase (DUF2520 family)
MDKVSIIGIGKLGSHLFYALKNAGYKHIFKIEKKTTQKYFDNAIQNSDVIFICTKDSDINNVVGILSTMNPTSSKKIIFHNSGAINSGILKPLKNKKTAIGSFHPVQTFNTRTKRFSDNFKGIFIAIEGDIIAVKKGISIAKIVGSKPFIIDSKNKVLHHINSVIASNYLVTLIHQITKIYDKSSKSDKNKKIFINGFKNVKIFDIYEPLIRTTINNIGSEGVFKALTGPIARNDYNTLELHLKSLKKLDYGILQFYVNMGIETINIALTKKSLKKNEAIKLTDLFNKYSNK